MAINSWRTPETPLEIEIGDLLEDTVENIANTINAAVAGGILGLKPRK